MHSQPSLSDSIDSFEATIDNARIACDGMNIQQLQRAFRSASQLVQDITENICFKAKHPTTQEVLESTVEGTVDGESALDASAMVGGHRWRRFLLDASEGRACLVCQRKRQRAVLTVHGCAQCVFAGGDPGPENAPVPLCSALCHAVHHEEAASQLHSATQPAVNTSADQSSLQNGKATPDISVVASLLSQLAGQSPLAATINSPGSQDLSTLLQSQILASLCHGINNNAPSMLPQNGTLTSVMSPSRAKGRPRVHNWAGGRGGLGERRPRARGSRAASMWGEHQATPRGSGRRGRPPLHTYNSAYNGPSLVPAARKRSFSGGSSGSDLPAIKPLEKSSEEPTEGLDLSCWPQPQPQPLENEPALFPSGDEKPAQSICT